MLQTLLSHQVVSKIKIGFYLMALTLVLSACDSKEKNNQGNESVPPPLQLVNIDGSPVDFEKYGNKAIFVNFWATWCKPCIEEMPSLETMEQRLEGEKIAFFYASQEGMDRITDFKSKKKFNLNFVRSETSLTSIDVYALPTTFIYKNGEIVYGQTGATDWSSEETINDIKAIIND